MRLIPRFLLGLLPLLLIACELPFSAGNDSLPTPIPLAATLPAANDDSDTAVTNPNAIPTPTPPSTTAPLPTATHDATLAEWTVLIYMDADNNLELPGLLDLNEMEAAGSSDKVNVLVQVDRAVGETTDQGDWTDTRRYRITGDADPQTFNAEPLLTLGEQNMGDPAVLADFIRWGVQNYPANHTALIIWDHGAGWNGIAFDGDTAVPGTEDHISLPDLEGALASALENSTLNQFDVIGFDACLMGQLDVFNAVRPFAQYAVGSEELTPGLGWDYENLLRNLYADPGQSADLFANQMVNDFISYYTNAERDDFVTMSAVDLSQLPNLTYNLELLATALANNPNFVASAVGDARSGAESFARVYPDDYNRYAAIDLHHFASLLAQRSPDEQVKQAAQNVVTAVEQATLNHGHGSGFHNSQGIAVYFPRNADYYDASYPDITKLPNWNTFLTSYHQIGQADLPAPEISVRNVLNNIVGVQDPAFVEFQVVGRDIEDVVLLAGLYLEDGRQLLVEYNVLIPEPTHLPDSSQIEEWRDGVHDDFFVWDTEVTYLYDEAGNGDYVVMWPTDPDSQLFTVQGQLRRAFTEEFVDANLVFDHNSGQLSRVWAVQSNDSDAPAEILPQAADEFQMYHYFYNDDGRISREAGTLFTFDDAGQLYFDWLPLPDGNYFLGMQAENVAGDTAVDTIDLTIANNERRDGYAAYLDPYLGFKFLYPEAWPNPRYEDTLLYTIGQITNTQLLVTIYPNLERGITPETLKQQTLEQFGEVDILFEEERLVAGLQALSTAYGYIGQDDVEHSGVFLTFIDNNRNGFVVDLDGPSSDEANTVKAIVTIADTWEFSDAGVGLQPGKWATVDLDTFSVAQPANFTYQHVNDWERFNAGQHTFVALRTQPASRDTAGVVSALVRDAGAGVDNFEAGEPFTFPLGGERWTRVDFSYNNADAGPIWGFIMARVEAEQEVVAWAEAPSQTYNELESSTFLTMIADLTLAE